MIDLPAPSTPLEAFDRVRAAQTAVVAEVVRARLHPDYGYDEDGVSETLAVPLLRELRAIVALHFAIDDALHFVEGDSVPDDIAHWFVRAEEMSLVRVLVLRFSERLHLLSRACRNGGALHFADVITAYDALTRWHEPFGLAPGAVDCLRAIMPIEAGFMVATDSFAGTAADA